MTEKQTLPQDNDLCVSLILQCRQVSNTTGKLVGVVGTVTSGVTTKMANFLKLFKVPQVGVRIEMFTCPMFKK